jgi:hypothetical protein
MIADVPEWRVGDKVIYRNKPVAVATQPDKRRMFRSLP